MLGNVFISIYYWLPIKVDFTRAFNMKASTIFSKSSLNIFAISVSAVITLSSSTRTIFSSLRILSIKLGFILFQKCLLSVTFFPLRLLQQSFFDLLRSLTHQLRCLLYANWFSGQLNFLSLLRRRVRVIIALGSSLFINTA